MDDKKNSPWQQQSTGAWLFIIALLSITVVIVVAMSWAPAVSGNQGAVENLLVSFGAIATALSALAAMYNRPKLVTVGAPVWAAAFYGSSLLLDDMVHGHTAGTAIRVGAMSALSFVIALSYLHRRAAH